MTLRIRRSTERKLAVLMLAGRIQADQLAGLEALLESESAEGEVGLDLRDVKLVDRDAVRFLARREATGTRLMNCAAYIRAWISQEANNDSVTRPGDLNASGE